MPKLRHSRGLPIEQINHEDLLDMPDVGGVNSDHDARYYTEAELGSIIAPSGASLIGVEDVGGFFAGADVEAILQEIPGVILPGAYLRLDGTNIPTANYNWTTNLTTTGTLQGGTLTDGTATLTGGAWTGATYNGLTITTGVNTFTLTRGTTDLIVSADCTINQNLSNVSSPTFSNLTITNNLTIGGTVDGVDISAFRTTYDAHDHSAADPTQVSHANLTNVTANQHHAQSHTIVSHDTGATGAELDTLTDNSMADTLHRHSELSASDGTPDRALVVDAIGRVGIGTPTPTQRLHIDASSATQYAMIAQDATHTIAMGWWYDATVANAYGILATHAFSNPLKIDASVVLLQSRSGGNVGVNTDSPASMFDVNLNVGGDGIRFADAGTDQTKIIFDEAGSDIFSIYYDGQLGGDDNKLIIRRELATAKDIMTITAGGNLDLSAGNFITTGTVQGVTQAEFDDLTDNSMADTLHRHSELSASDGTPDAVFKANAIGDIGFGVTPEADWEKGAGGYYALQIGNRGAISGRIGTASPIIIMSENKVHTSSGDEYIASAAATQYVQTAGNHQFQVAASGTAGNVISWTEGLYIDNAGSVGIGLTNPQSLLSVGGVGHATRAIYGYMGSVSGTGVGVYGESADASGHGMEAYGTGTSGIGVWGSGTVGGWAFYAAGTGGTYGPFTGAHEVKLSSDFPLDVKPGMIVSVTGETQVKRDLDGISISSTLPTVTLSNTINDIAVLGVFVSGTPLREKHWYKINKGKEKLAIVNALGDGRAWVSNINGEVQVGDYITTSKILGYGMRQDDDVLHSYTLGKATEHVNWKGITETIRHDGKEYKIYLIGVVYTSG